MNGTSPKAVVFDMDGVIFDTEPVWLEAETSLYAKRGIHFPPELAKKIMGVPGAAAMKIVADALGIQEEPAALSRELNGIFHDLVESRLHPMDGLLDRLEHLERIGIPKGVATSTERTLARKMLAKSGLLDRFVFVFTRDDVTHGKPHPEIYEKSCAAHGIEPWRTVVIEDSVAGTESARAAGCYVVALRHPLTALVEFSSADLVVDHHNDARVAALFETGR